MSRLAQKSHFAQCPACDTKLRFAKLPLPGDLLTCIECRESLEVISLFPIQLDWGYLDAEADWSEEIIDDGDAWVNGRFDDWNSLLEGVFA